MIFKEGKIHTWYIETWFPWVARNQGLDLRNYLFQRCRICFAFFFDEDNIVILGIDHAICEEIAAADG